MYNIFFKVLIIALIVSTLSILGLKPKMHKRIFVIDSSYSIVEEPEDNEEENIIPEQTTVEVVEKKVSDNKKVETKEKQVSPKKVVSKTQTTPKKVETKKIEPKENTVKTVQKAQTEPKKQEAKVVVKAPETPKKEVKTQTQAQAQTQTQTQTKAQAQPKPKQTVLTEQEEEIAWNIWRSNLQNQIMKDTKLPYIPKGTIFKFSFDVDKYGRISNIKTYSKNPNYTPYAIQYIAPVIRSYQGKDILEFPKGTQRLTTKFEGGWKIADSAKYSTPDDYNDIEKVKK